MDCGCIIVDGVGGQGVPASPIPGQGGRPVGAQFLPMCSKMSGLESPVLGPRGTWVL